MAARHAKMRRVIWTERHFAELSPHEVYDVLRLRSTVFVVEQNCVFLDMDNHDQNAYHLIGSRDGLVLAYARLLAPGQVYDEASIGRVVTAPACRRGGFGRMLMSEAIARVESRWGRVPIRIGAQKYLEAFYGGFGFVRDSDDYVEDGIPHVHMLRAPSIITALDRT